MGDGRAEGSSAIGDRGQAAISLTPDVDGMHVRIFESSQLEGMYAGDLLYWFLLLLRSSSITHCAGCRQCFIPCASPDLVSVHGG